MKVSEQESMSGAELAVWKAGMPEMVDVGVGVLPFVIAGALRDGAHPDLFGPLAYLAGERLSGTGGWSLSTGVGEEPWG